MLAIKIPKGILPKGSKESENVFYNVLMLIVVLSIAYVLWNVYAGISAIKEIPEKAKEIFKPFYEVPKITDLETIMQRGITTYKPKIIGDLGVTQLVGKCPEGYYREFFGDTCKPTVATQLKLKPQAETIIPKTIADLGVTQLVGKCPEGYYRPLMGDLCIKGKAPLYKWADTAKSWFRW